MNVFVSYLFHTMRIYWELTAFIVIKSIFKHLWLLSFIGVICGVCFIGWLCFLPILKVGWVFSFMNLIPFNDVAEVLCVCARNMICERIHFCNHNFAALNVLLKVDSVDLSSLWAHTAPRELSQEQAIPSELAALPDAQARLSLLVSHTRRANCQKQRALTSCT